MTTHQVALTFEDGVTRFITCAEDQTVADASYRARINIPLDCRDGACGTCKAVCESGDYDGGAYIDDALSPDEAAAGKVLPCCMKPRSDLVLQIASTSAVAKTGAATHEATLTSIDRLSATTVALTVEVDRREELTFLPGQYVNIQVPGTGESRSYSFSTAPEEGTLGFLVKLTPGGVMSTWLTERAAAGDRLTFTGPHGSFFLRESTKPLLLLSGGTGLAPILSILRTLRAAGSARPVHLVHGVSTDEDLVETGTLEALAAAMPTFSWDHCVSDPASTAVNRGFVTDLMAAEHLHDGDVAVYLCGPPPMVEAVRTHLADRGVEPYGFYYEKFALSGPAPATAPTPEAPAPEAPASEAPAPEGPAAVQPVQPVQPVQTVQSVQTVPSLDPAGERRVARTVTGQEVFTGRDLAPLQVSSAEGVRRLVAGLSQDPAARSVTGQEVFAGRDLAPLHAPAVAPVTPGPLASDGYEIGEQHPSVETSDALFDARTALELGALDLVLGRLDDRELAAYRALAEATVPHVAGSRFVDAVAYTTSNAAFHDHLIALTGNEHLLRAYQALGVEGRMHEALASATWCDPRCPQDHVDLADALARGDRAEARRVVTEHGQRSRATMRRAMEHDADRAPAPRFTTPGRFAGKVVVVTGAAQGIGEAVARRVGAEGGALVLVDRSDLVHGLADELAGSTTGGAAGAPGGAVSGALGVVADLETYAGATTVAEMATARFGRIDVLVNNVGGAINFKPFTEFTEAEIAAEVQRSLMTTLLTTRAVLPGMVAQGHGVVVNVSSAATRGIHRIPYSAAKGGVNALTASLALEYAPAGVRVVATAPGGTEAPPRRISRGTPEPTDEQERQWFQAHVDQTLDHSLLGRYGSLDEQAAAITFLASDEASYITGSVLPVAGGDLG